MKIKQALCGLVAAVAIGLTGCEKSEKKDPFVYGTVIKEAGTIVDRQKIIERAEGAIFGNDSIRFGDSTYILQIQTNQGLYTANVEKFGNKTLEALALAIEEGTEVKIERRYLEDKWRFGEDKIGKLCTDEIVVLYGK